MIGAGNLATQLARSLPAAGHEVVQVYSRSRESAELLAGRMGCEAVTELAAVRPDADVYVFAVKDSVLSQLVAALPQCGDDSVLVHTAGSMPMDLFASRSEHYGVFYPMQTFSKQRDVDFRQIPAFIESSDAFSHDVLFALASSLCDRVVEMSTEDRRYLHLAAVWACNFVNHCYDITSEVLSSHGIPFDVMLPLIDETARKVHELTPKQAQTGPAVRYDTNVMDRHIALMAGEPQLQQLYKALSESIHNRFSNDRKQ